MNKKTKYRSIYDESIISMDDINSRQKSIDHEFDKIIDEIKPLGGPPITRAFLDPIRNKLESEPGLAQQLEQLSKIIRSKRGGQ